MFLPQCERPSFTLVGRHPSQPVSVLRPLPYPVTHRPNGKANFEPNPFSYKNPTFPNLINSSHNHLPKKMEQCVPKRRHTKFRRRGITQKRAYNKDLCTFTIIFRSLLLRTRNVQKKFAYRIKTRVLCSVTFLPKIVPFMG
jgi:hypothetical protein